MLRQRFLSNGLLLVAGLALLLAGGAVAIWNPGDFGPRIYSGEPQAVILGADSPKRPEAHRLYTKYCVACHGADGKGTDMREKMPTIPDFTSRKWQDEASDAQLTVSILEGKGTLMPAYRDALTEEQVKEMVGYVRDFASPPAPAKGEASP